MFSDQDISSHIRAQFPGDGTRTKAIMAHVKGSGSLQYSGAGGRGEAARRGAFDAELIAPPKLKPSRFSLADILNANSRITIEEFRRTIPRDSASGGVPAGQVAA
jgi:hypothetical protein